MAYNYTVSEFTFTEATTDAVYAGNMISGGTMTITPNSGYVVSASSFSASGTLPGQFASIAFADSAVAGEVNNTVIVTFVFSTLFEMSPALNNINLPITGHADLVEDKRFIDFHIDFIDETIKNLNGSSTVTSFGSAVTQTGPTGSTTITTTLSATNVTAGFFVQIGTLVVTADDNPDYNFINPPSLRFENVPQGAISLQLSSVTRRDGETNTVKEWNYKIMFISENSITSLFGAKVFIEYTGVLAKSTTKEIKQIIIGNPEIPTNGTTKVIKIVGDTGVEFDLTVTKNSDDTSIIDTTLANADIIHHRKGLIRGINKTLISSDSKQLFATYQFNQTFPAVTSNEIYHINVTPKNGAILNSNLAQAAPQEIIYQYINPTITINTDDDGGGNTYDVTSQTSISYRGRPNKKTSQLQNMRKIVDLVSFTYVYTVTSGGTTFTTANTPVWSMTDANSNWDQSVTNHGNIIEIVNIAIERSSANTVATVTGDIIIKKFGTADVTFTLDSSDFLTVT
tara:strand:+ start:6718 stop:8253 length:1536 start_codon:yes stop_codon:yes gene_type:complete